MSEPKGYVDTAYLDLAGQVLRPAKAHSYARMQIQAGSVVLDVGCGPGIDTVLLGGLVGAEGAVVGLDYDEGMVAEADRRAAEAGVSNWVRHLRAEATSLPFQSGTFDAVRSERLFQHLHDPIRALGEIARVTKTGGSIVVLDTDWGTLSIDTEEPDISRRLARVLAEECHHNGYAGRQLYGLFRQHGLAEVSIEMFPIPTTSYRMACIGLSLGQGERHAIETGAVTSEELSCWHSEVEQREAAGRFFASMSLMLVAGRKI
jgi:ubiquinone/menaquinone biosynthesis C-methylase UbiE